MIESKLQYQKPTGSNKSKEARRRLRSILDKVCLQYGTTVEVSRCPMKNNRKVTYLLKYGIVDHLSCFIREKKDDIILIPNGYTVCFEANSHVWVGRTKYKQKTQHQQKMTPFVTHFEVVPVDSNGVELVDLSSDFQENISAAFKISLSKMRSFSGQSERLDKASLRPNGRLYIGIYYSTVQKKLRDYLRVQRNNGELEQLSTPLKTRINWWIELENSIQQPTNTPKPMQRPIIQRKPIIQPATTNVHPPTNLGSVNLSSFPNPLQAVPSFNTPLLDMNLFSILNNRALSQPSFNIPMSNFNNLSFLNLNKPNNSTITHQQPLPQPQVQGSHLKRERIDMNHGFFKGEIKNFINNLLNSNVSVQVEDTSTKVNTIIKVLDELKQEYSQQKRLKLDRNNSLMQLKLPIPTTPTFVEDINIEEIDYTNLLDNAYNKLSFGNLTALFEEPPTVVSCNMTPKALYLTLDIQKNQSVGEKEIKRALKCLKIPVNSSIVRKTYEACDKDGDGKISLQEFVEYLHKREEELKQMFQKMDLNNDGYVTLEELKLAREAGRINASDEELKGLIEWMDNTENSSKDGKIDFEEFRTCMVLFPPATTIQEILYLLQKK